MRQASTYKVRNVFKNIAQSQTDSAVVAAVSAKIIAVVGLVLMCGGTATTCVFNTKPTGAGSAISMTFAAGANGGAAMPFSEAPWFFTNVGEGLSATTGAGSTTGMQVLYILI